MTPIIVDGYNVIGTSHRNLEDQREKFIELLAQYGKRKRHPIIVVFDGWRNGRLAETSSVRGGVKVIYSRLAEKADAVIKRIIVAEKCEWIVVSSDRDVQGAAWAAGSIPIPSEAFLSRIGEDIADGRTDDDLGDDDEISFRKTARGGNPRQRSKKERAVQRALNKL